MLSGNFAEMTTSTPFRDLLHAENLRHGTDGFTSPPKEGVLRIFSEVPRKKFPSDTTRNRSQRLNHYATPGPRARLMEFVITLDHRPVYVLGVKFVSGKFTHMETARNLKITSNKLKGESGNRHGH